METVYDIRKIMSLLPHRYPFLLVDRVLELTPGERISVLKNVSINEPFFQGHYPGMPIMPGVLIVEAMAQAGGILAFSSLPEEMHGKPVYFMGIDKVKFRLPVVPGDRIVFEVRMLRQRARAMKMGGVATVEGKRVSEAELLATIGESA
jgi:3-hydroxyacyl-[acyl-carrier-protein] dehydratase